MTKDCVYRYLVTFYMNFSLNPTEVNAELRILR